jgi:DHA2 family multidrug resistance protein-like MFS transporter
VLGPLLGGVLLEYFWWGSVFLLAVPAMALLLALGPLLLPEFRDPAAGRLDVSSAALSLVAVLAVIYGIKRIAEHGPAELPALAIAAGIAAGAAFVRRQRALADPLIDLGLFRAPAFSASLAVNTLAFFAMLGVYLFITQYLQLVLGLSPLSAGLWTVPSSGGFIVGSMLTPVIARRVRPARVMVGGLALAAAGFLVLTAVDGASGLAAIVTGSALVLLGLAPVYILATDMIVASAPPERVGAAAAISETSAELGGALGIAVLGSVGTAVYRSMMADAVPAGIPPAAAQSARATLGGALAVAERLPGPLGAELLGKAREAFAQGLELTAAISVAVMMATAIVAAAVLRRVGVVAVNEA